MEKTLKRLQIVEQKIEALSQQKNNIQQARFEEQQRINKNHQTRLWFGLVCVCFILFNVIIYRLYF